MLVEELDCLCCRHRSPHTCLPWLLFLQRSWKGPAVAKEQSVSSNQGLGNSTATPLAVTFCKLVILHKDCTRKSWGSSTKLYTHWVHPLSSDGCGDSLHNKGFLRLPLYELRRSQLWDRLKCPYPSVTQYCYLLLAKGLSSSLFPMVETGF